MNITDTLPRPAQPTPADPFPATPMLPMPATTYVYCPTCGQPVHGLLAGCDQKPCLTAELDYDAALDLRSNNR